MKSGPFIPSLGDDSFPGGPVTKQDGTWRETAKINSELRSVAVQACNNLSAGTSVGYFLKTRTVSLLSVHNIF